MIVLVCLPQLLLAAKTEYDNYYLYIFVALMVFGALVYFLQWFVVWVFMGIKNMKQVHRNEQGQKRKNKPKKD